MYQLYTLINNLSASYNISKEKAGNILEENGFSKTIRSEVLTVDEIVKLSLIFKEQKI